MNRLQPLRARRRMLIRLLGALGFGAVWPTVRLGDAMAESSAVIGERHRVLLRRVFPDPDAAQHIGRRHLARQPDSKSVEEWFRQTGLDRSGAGLGAFKEMRDHDFRLGRTVLVDGWLMTHSEIAVCVLLCVLELQPVSP